MDDPNIATLPPFQSLQLLLKRCCPGLSFGIALGKIRKHTDPAHPVGLLRTRRERPCHRGPAEHRHELAALHSITSSARASSVAGTSRPSTLAVCRLMRNSKLVERTIGRSVGFSPLRRRPV